jgi:hypothetical protein
VVGRAPEPAPGEPELSPRPRRDPRAPAATVHTRKAGISSLVRPETTHRSGKRGHGEGTIGQRPDGRWYGQVMIGYQLDGKKDVRTV